ncbi:MAG: hypothetical protein V3R52_00695, partial [Candidatus Neomarinimicrobiota bacterium]
LLPGVFFIILSQNKNKRNFQKILITFIFIGVPLLIWFVEWALLGYSHLERLTPHGGRYSAMAYGSQLITGIQSLMSPNLYGFQLILVLSPMVFIGLYFFTIRRKKQKPRQMALKQMTYFAFFGLFGLYLLFNFVIIADPLSTRFLWFFIILIMGILMCVVTWMQKGIYYNILIIIITTLAMLQTGRVIIKISSAQDTLSYPHIEKHYTISPHHIDKPPMMINDKLVVSPPTYTWLYRNYKTDFIPND